MNLAAGCSSLSSTWKRGDGGGPGYTVQSRKGNDASMAQFSLSSFSSGEDRGVKNGAKYLPS